MKRTFLIALMLGAVFFITAGSCYAQEINGCVKNGQLSIASGPGQCKSSETPISWNVTGPQGPQGLQGPQGPQGLPGVTTGISAAVWGEFELSNTGTPSYVTSCSALFSSGAASFTASGGPNDGQCNLTLTLPAGQTAWGTMYSCYSSIVGTGAPQDATCRYYVVADSFGNPTPIFQCVNVNGLPAVPTTYRIHFLCIN